MYFTGSSLRSTATFKQFQPPLVDAPFVDAVRFKRHIKFWLDSFGISRGSYADLDGTYSSWGAGRPLKGRTHCRIAIEQKKQPTETG
jgi:hypothetical protein